MFLHGKLKIKLVQVEKRRVLPFASLELIVLKQKIMLIPFLQQQLKTQLFNSQYPQVVTLVLIKIFCPNLKADLAILY